jgi:hypothetical protein
MTSPQAKDYLLQARDLINQKRYTEARAVLMNIPADPTAQKWLAKLDTIAAPPLPSPVMTPLLAEAPPIPSLPAWAAKPPKDPSSIAMWWIFFIPVAIVKYARNWERLGKPDWVWPTALFWLLLYACGVFSAILFSQWASSNVMVFGLTSLLGMTNVAFWVIIGHLQERAYKTWKATRNPEALLNHVHKFDKTIAATLVICPLIGIGIAAALWYEAQPDRFQNGHFSVGYESNWDKESSDNVGFCQEYDNGCFLVLMDQPFENTIIVFVERPLGNQRWDLEGAEQSGWDFSWAGVPGLDIAARYETEIGGAPAICREFSYPQEDDEPLYAQWCVVLYGQSWYEISAWAANANIYEDDRDKIMDVINSIEFK